MANGKLKLAVVGAGRHGRDLGRAARESGRFELTVCCDLVPDLASLAKDSVGYRHSVNTVEEALDHDVEAFIIATSHDALAPMATVAARAGKHVYVEKPMGLSAEEAEGLVRTTAERGVSLMVGYCLRYLPSRVEMKEQIDSGAIGEMVSITSAKTTGRYTKGALTDPNRGGGALLFVGSHQIDQIIWLAGQMPESVTGKVVLVPENGTDDTSWFTLEFADGLVAQAYCSQNAGAVVDYVDAVGTKGRIRGDYPTNEVWIQSQVIPEYGDRTYIVKAPPMMPEDWPSPMSNMYIDELSEFADSIQQRREPAIPGQAGVDTLRVIDAIKKSSDSDGARVAL